MNTKELAEAAQGWVKAAEELKAAERNVADQRAIGTVYLENAIVHLKEAASQLGLKADLVGGASALPPSALPPTNKL